MGKASSKKKIARAAKAGGGRARAAGERNVLFPTVLTAVVVLGTTLIVYARDQRSAVAEIPPIAFQDHWHAAAGFYVCDHFVDDIPEFEPLNNGGIHSHGDGLIHIHPFSQARAGENATLNNYLADAGDALGGGTGLTDDSLGIPGGETYTEGEDTCEGVDGDPIVQVRYWTSARDGGDPEIITENFDDIRFTEDGAGYVVAFAPLDADIPLPPSTDGLDNVSDVEPTTTTTPEGSPDSTTTTEPDGSDGSTTTEPEGSTTTAPDEGGATTTTIDATTTTVDGES